MGYMTVESHSHTRIHLKRLPGFRSWALLVVVAKLNHLRDVSVEEERVRYLGKGFLVVLRFATGFSHPLTQSTTLGGRSDAYAIAELLKRFLGLDKAQQWEKVSDSDSSDSDQIELDEK